MTERKLMRKSDNIFTIGLILLFLGVMIIAGAGIAKGKEIAILEQNR